MPVITMILNYNGKHTNVLLERPVGTQPAHPFAPSQRRHQRPTWVICSSTELPIVNYGGQQMTVMRGETSLLYRRMRSTHSLCRGFLIIYDEALLHVL